MNERWRVALAGLVAALAIPFLIIDSPAPAEGVVTNGDEVPVDEPAAPRDALGALGASAKSPVAAEVLGRAIEIVVVSQRVSPDISRLADQAGAWGTARAQAIADGRVVASAVPAPSNTNLALLPVVKVALPVQVPVEEPTDPVVEPTEPVEEPTDPVEEPTDPVSEPTEPVDEPTDPVVEPTDPVVEPTDPVEEPTEPTDPVEEPVEPIEREIDVPTVPRAPAQVDGRVPPPSGGPTAAQWNALRKCESTHSYLAISPSGLYRGAYQFSQQTWDWVAGIHQPHLVGIDPIDAEPAWQDIMAYTLYAMRGWDQWPICGKNLL